MTLLLLTLSTPALAEALCDCLDDDGDGLIDEDLSCEYPVEITVSADDTLSEASMDGAPFETGAYANFDDATAFDTWRFDLARGEHTLEISAENETRTYGALIASVAIADALRPEYSTGQGAWSLRVDKDDAELEPDEEHLCEEVFLDGSWPDWEPLAECDGAAPIWIDCPEALPYSTLVAFELVFTVCPDDGYAETAPTLYPDADADGYGAEPDAGQCVEVPAGYSDVAGDCDDDDRAISPGADEIAYDGADNDCDPSTPDDDLDGDGVLLADDCDDSDAAIGPEAAELCDGVDQDCDGAIDEGAGDVWYSDADGDGHGGEEGVTDCADPSGNGPSGYLADSTDCDDTDPDVHPDAAESCDSRDEDCDGAVDESDDGGLCVDGAFGGTGCLASVSPRPGPGGFALAALLGLAALIGRRR